MAWHSALYDGKLGYLAQDDRQLVEAALGGVGVIDIGDLSVSAASGLNSQIAAGRALIRNSFLSTQGGLYLARNDGLVTYAHTAADPTNPRIDQVLAKVYDSESGGDASDQTSGLVVTGTPTGGATLDNRTGAGSLAAINNYIPLADVLVPASAASAASFTYRDRRPLVSSFPPPIKTNVLSVTLQPFPILAPAQGGITSAVGNYVNQFAYAVTLPRRIVGATKIRWIYMSGVSIAGSYNIGIADASGRVIVSTGAVAFTGTSSALQSRSETIASTTLEAGVYYVVFCTTTSAGPAFFTAVPPVLQSATSNIAAAVPNVLLYSTTGSTTMPATVLGYTDSYASAAPASGGALPQAPVVSLSTT